MQHRFASPVSQSVAYAARSRLRPVVSLSDAPTSGTHRSGRCRRKQVPDRALLRKYIGFRHLSAGNRARTLRFRESTKCPASAGHQYKATVHGRASKVRASVKQSCKSVSLLFALEQRFSFLALQPRPARPNHSLKRSANGVAHWPSGAGASPHFAPAVQRATPSSPA